MAMPAVGCETQMTTKTQTPAELLSGIPEPEVLKARLEENQRERSILRKLLTIANERAEKQREGEATR